MAYETTGVAVEASQAGVRRLLREYGCEHFEFGEGAIDGAPHAAVGFSADGLRVRVRVPLKPVDEKALARRQQRARTPERRAALRSEMEEQEARRIWRVIHWNLKARMEAVAEDVETFAEAFLAHIIDEQTNMTIYESLSKTGQIDLGAPLALPPGS